MANQDPKGTSNYWYEGASSTLIIGTSAAPIGTSGYWINGSPQGFIVDNAAQTFVRTRNFAVLIGF